jgi:hypothetical protein
VHREQGSGWAYWDSCVQVVCEPHSLPQETRRSLQTREKSSNIRTTYPQYKQGSVVMSFVSEAQEMLGCGERNKVNLKLLENCKDQLAPFVGAGLSMKHGYPSWHVLMERLGQATESLDTVQAFLAAGQFEEAAEHIAQVGPHAFDDVLKDIFRAHEETSERNLGALYSRAPGSPKPIYDIQLRKRCLLKLHGDNEDLNSMVLTLTQYRNAYGSEDLTQVDIGLPLP